MAAPIAAEMLRELHASVRQFSSAKAALLWYRDQIQARLRVNRDPAAVGNPASQEHRDEVHATFAAIAQCLRREHPSDPTDEDEREATRYRVSGTMLTWLVAWYESDGWGDGTWLAERAGLSREVFTTRCKRTERVLIARLRIAGLLREK